MKQNLFNKLWLRVGMIVAIMTTALAGTVKAAPEDIDLSGGTFSTDHITWTGTSVTIQQLKGTSGTAVNSSYISAPRVYKEHILSFVANTGYKINSISITYNSTNFGNSMTAGTVISNNTVTDNPTDVNRTWDTNSGGTHVVSAVNSEGLPAIYIQNVASGANVQLRPTAISITYTSSGSTPTTYTVTFNAGEGTFVGNDAFPNVSNTKAAGSYTLPSATRDGYTFNGWLTTGSTEPLTGSYTVSGNVDFTASYTQNGSSGTATATLTSSNLELSGSSYQSGTKTINGITYSYTDLMPSSNRIQAKASSGEIKNTTPYPGDITSVVITHDGTARATTINGSADGTNWTQVATGSGSITADFSGKGYKYFQITRGSNAAYWTKVEINYSTSSSSLEQSDLAITNASTALAFDLYNNATAQVINYTTSSTGAITITPASPTEYFSYVHDAANKTITVTPLAVTPSAQTVTVNQAADATYAAGSATFTVSVDDSTPSSGVDVTFLAGTDKGSTTSNGSADEVTKSVVTMSSTDAAFATAEYRFYQGSVTTFSTTSGKITKIVFTETGGKPCSNLSTTIGTYENNIWTGNASSVAFTASAQARASKVVVTVEDDGSIAAPIISGTTSFYESTTVTITAGEGATIYYTTDNTTPTTSSTQYGTPFTISATTTIKAIAVIGGNVSEVAEQVFTKATVMTVAEAIAYIATLGGDTSEDDVYVSGIVSQVDSYNATYHSITYWISDDGTTTSQMEVYSGKGLNGNEFSSKDDLQLGDEVIVCGKVKSYNNISEFIQNSKLVFWEYDRKESTGLAYATTTITKTVGDASFTNTLTNPNNLAVSYASSDEDVATIDNTGEVTIVSVGTTTITASYPGDDTYMAGSASYTLTIEEPFSVEDGVFDFVAAAAAGYDYGSGITITNQSNHYEPNASTWTAGNVTLVAEGNYRWWYNGHELRFQKNNGTMTISVPAGKTITAIEISGGKDWTTEVGTYTDGSWSGSSQTVVFTAGGNTGNNVTKVVVSYSESVTVTDAGYATYCSANALDFTGTDITAYVGTIDGTHLTFTPITQVPANTGLLLKAEGGATVNVPVIASADPVQNNCLTGVLEQTTLESTDYILNVNVNSGKAGFYKAGQYTTLAAHRAYIPASLGGGVKSFFIDLDDDATAIGTVESFTEEGAIYNVAGQRLNKMQKGINIVNGKKILK